MDIAGIRSVKTGSLPSEEDPLTSKDNPGIQHDQLENLNRDLKQAYVKQLQSEKMASIGLLAAGVAHEINNPIGFVSSNLQSLEKYIDKLCDFVAFQDQTVAGHSDTQLSESITAKRKQLKIDAILKDISELLAESRDGVGRVGKIVSNLKGFSHISEADHQQVDITESLESAIDIAWSEIKSKATLNRNFAPLPKIPCYPGQLHQVFVNLLVNAAQSIATQGSITVETWQSENFVHIRITDSGCGISEKNCRRVFDPFFTTKEVGRGTGLGLSISYDIIKTHQGEISVESRLEQGTSFTISLPICPDDPIIAE